MPPMTDLEYKNRLDEIRRRREMMEALQRQLSEATGHTKIGLLDIRSLSTALDARVPVLSAPGSQVEAPYDYPEMTRRLEAANHAARKAGASFQAGADTTWMQAAGHSAWETIAGAGIFAAQAAEQVIGRPLRALTGDDPEVFRPREMTERRQQAEHNKLLSAFGMPEDPVEREMYATHFPMSARLVGTAAATIAMMRVMPPISGTLSKAVPLPGRVLSGLTRGQVGLSAGSAAQLALRTEYMLNRVSRLGPMARVALGGGGATVGYHLAPEDADGYEKARYAIAGFGAGALLPAAFLGQPRGAVARAIFRADQKMLAQAGNPGNVRAAARALGRAWTHAPNLTLGRTLDSASLGAWYGASIASAQGKPFDQALQEGLIEGLNWVALDAVGARVGNTARWAGLVNRQFAKRTAFWMEQMGYKPSTSLRTGGTQQTGVLAAASALLGAGGGAVGGPLGAAVGIATPWFFRRTQSLLPKELLDIVRKQGWRGLNPEQVGQVASVTARGIVADIAMNDVDDPAMKAVLRQFVGQGPALTRPEYEVLSGIAGLQSRINALLGPGEEFPSDPRAVQAILRMLGEVGRLRERFMQLTSERGEVFSPRSRAGYFLGEEGLTARWMSRLQRRANAMLPVAEEAQRARFMESEGRILSELADEQLENLGAARARLNAEMSLARTSIEDELTPDEVWRELSRARGESPAKTRARFRGDLAAGMDELAMRRASVGSPTRPLTKKTKITVTSRTEARRLAEQHVDARDTLDDLLDLGAQDLDEATARDRLKPLGGSVRVQGAEYVVSHPFTGEVRAPWLRAALETTRERLRTALPGFAVAGPGFVVAPDDDGTPLPGWMPTAAGVAALTTVGMVISPWKSLRFPLRMSNIARQMTDLLRRSSEKFDREMVFIFDASGDVGVYRGDNVKIATHASRVGGARALSRGGVPLMVHNHPSGATVGDRIVDSLPSDADVVMALRLAPPQAQYATGLIATPTGVLSFTIPADRFQRATAPMLGHEIRTLYEVAVDTFRKALVLRPDAPGREVINEVVSKGRLTEANVLSLLDDAFRDAGITIQRDLSDGEIDLFVKRALSREHTPSVSAQMKTSAEESVLDNLGPQVGKIGDALTDEIAASQKALGKVADTGRPMAPAGAGAVKKVLPDSVTPQAVTRAPELLDDARTWAAENGLTLEIAQRDGRRTFVFRVGDADGVEVAAGITLREAYGGLANEARKQGITLINPERGAAPVSAVIQAALGSFAGATVAAYMSEEGDDPSLTGLVVGGIIGGFGAPLIAAVASGMIPNRIGARVLKLIEPGVENRLTPDASARLVGKTDTTKQQFFRMQTADQYRHAANRLNAHVALDAPAPRSYPASVADTPEAQAAYRAQQKRETFVRLVRRWTPLAGDEAQLRAWERTVRDGAETLGFDAQEANLIVLGAYKEMIFPYTRRVFPRDTDLRVLARDARTPAGAVSDVETMRRLITTAEIMSGPAVPSMSNRLAASAARRNLMDTITPRSEHMRGLSAIANEEDLTLRGLGEVEGMNRGLIPAALLPPERFRSIGESLRAKGDAVGGMILNLYDGIMVSTEKFEVEFLEASKKLGDIFNGFTLDQRVQIRRLMEDPAARDAARTNWTAGYRAATEFRRTLDEIAERAGMQPGQRIEDYFPWYYSQRTIRELQRAGTVPDDIVMPFGSGIPEYKLFKNLLKRWADEPLGQMIDDPLEAGSIYLYGGLRKIHLDPLVYSFDNNFFKELQRHQPFVAAEGARWLLDVFGVPRKSYLAWLARFRSMGIRLEDIADRLGLPAESFWRETIDRYFMSPGSVGNLTRFARGFAFYSKLGGLTTSSLVNFSQLAVNSGADVGFGSLLVGGTSFLAQSGIDLAIEKLDRILPFPHPKLTGTGKLELGRSVGVYSDANRRALDLMADRLAIEQGRGVGLTLAAGGIGAAAGSLVGDEDNRLAGASAGAATAFTASVMAPRLLRRALRFPLHAAVAPFEAVEVINRGMTAGGALREAKQAARYDRGGLAKAAVRGEEIAEGLLTPTLAGAAAGSEFGDEETIGGAEGAGIGLAIGGLLTMGAKSRAAQTSEALARMTARASYIPGFQQALLNEARTLTVQDVEKWYARQILDMTQFRFGRAARPSALRTPMGEMMGALQTFTLNQMEFVGSRWQAFHESAARVSAQHGGGVIGTARAFGSRELDMRFWRHMYLLFGMGAAMTSLSTDVFEAERDPQYWLSRIGFGFVPLLHYNEDARQWNLTSIGEHLTGPFLNDIFRAASFGLRVAADREARDSYQRDLNRLSRQLFTGLKQLESAPETLAVGAEKLGAEGLADLLREQQEAATAIANPVTTLLGDRQEMY